MKTVGLLIILLSTVALKTLAQQSFAPLNAEWWYYNSTTDGPFSPFPGAVTHTTFHTRAASDTIINGQTCVKLTTAYNARSNRPTSPSSSSGFLKEFYFYDNTDTVFIYNENFNRFTPLYVFNVAEGDMVCLPVPPSGAPDLRLNPISGDTSFCFIVDSIRIRIYDTTHLRTYYTRALVKDTGNSFLPAYPAYNWGAFFWDTTAQLYTGVYTERILGNFFPNRLVRPVPDIPVFNTYAPYGVLRCYSDSLYHIKLSTEACDSITTPAPLSIHEIKTETDFAWLYPNPATNSVQISLAHPMAHATDVFLYDLSGRQLRRFNLPPNEQSADIDLSGMAAGTYIVILQSGSRYYYKLTVQR